MPMISKMRVVSPKMYLEPIQSDINGSIDTKSAKHAMPEIQMREVNNSQKTFKVCALLSSEMRLPIDAPIPSKIAFIRITT
jgi:hypothetical protein